MSIKRPSMAGMAHQEYLKGKNSDENLRSGHSKMYDPSKTELNRINSETDHDMAEELDAQVLLGRKKRAVEKIKREVEEEDEVEKRMKR